jgi:hypothetical protein
LQQILDLPSTNKNSRKTERQISSIKLVSNHYFLFPQIKKTPSHQ